MRITRTSMFTGQVHTLDLPVTEEQMREFQTWPRRNIQSIFPQLTNAEREFIKTGVTVEEWINAFPQMEE